MPMTRDQLLAEAQALDPKEREALADDLLLSLSGSDQREIDDAWLAEVRARDEAFRRGEMGSRPADEVIDELLAEFEQ